MNVHAPLSVSRLLLPATLHYTSILPPLWNLWRDKCWLRWPTTVTSKCQAIRPEAEEHNTIFTWNDVKRPLTFYTKLSQCKINSKHFFSHLQTVKPPIHSAHMSTKCDQCEVHCRKKLESGLSDLSSCEVALYLHVCPDSYSNKFMSPSGVKFVLGILYLR